MRIKNCPKCGSSRLLPIIYGRLTDNGEEMVKQGRFVSGGCICFEDSPTTVCQDCHYEFRDTSSEQLQAFDRLMRRAQLQAREQITGYLKPDEIDPLYDLLHPEPPEIVVRKKRSARRRTQISKHRKTAGQHEIMTTRKRRLNDGREGICPSDPKWPIKGLDRIPSTKLPDRVDMVFFGGGWFPLYYTIGMNEFKGGHIVFVSPFYISLRPVSIKQWIDEMDSYVIYKYRNYKSTSPVEVTWYDAVRYCNQRSENEELDKCYYGDLSDPICDWNANGYRLPTEAEFNYATPNYRLRYNSRPVPYPHELDLEELDKKYRIGPQDLINAYAETKVWDYFDPNYFNKSPKFDPTGPKTGLSRTYRYFRRVPLSGTIIAKPYRNHLNPYNLCQFFVVRSWIFSSDVHYNNQEYCIPQWDR